MSRTSTNDSINDSPEYGSLDAGRQRAEFKYLEWLRVRVVSPVIINFPQEDEFAGLSDSSLGDENRDRYLALGQEDDDAPQSNAETFVKVTPSIGSVSASAIVDAPQVLVQYCVS